MMGMGWFQSSVWERWLWITGGVHCRALQVRYAFVKTGLQASGVGTPISSTLYNTLNSTKLDKWAPKKICCQLGWSCLPSLRHHFNSFQHHLILIIAVAARVAVTFEVTFCIDLGSHSGLNTDIRNLRPLSGLRCLESFKKHFQHTNSKAIIVPNHVGQNRVIHEWCMGMSSTYAGVALAPPKTWSIIDQ